MTASSQLLLNLHFNNRLTRHVIAVLNFDSTFKEIIKEFAYRFEISPSPQMCKYDFFDFLRPCGSESRSPGTQRCVN